MAFTFTTRLDKGKNGTNSINGLLDSLVSAIASALTTGAIATAQIADLAVTTAKLAAGAVTTAKIDAAAVTGAKLDSGIISMKYSTGVDSTSAATDITITGITAGMRIADVIDVTAKANVDKTWFTVINGGVTQAIGHDTHTASMLFIFLPASA